MTIPDRFHYGNSRTKVDISSEGRVSFKNKQLNGKILERQSSEVQKSQSPNHVHPEQRAYHVVVHNTSVMTVTDKCTQTTSV